MNRNADEALIASILGRWGRTSNPAAATTAIATVEAVAGTRHTLDVLTASQRNQAAAAYTATLTVRDASAGGTILAQTEFVTAVNAVDRADLVLKQPGLVGNAIVALWDPPAASVTQKVHMSGWSDQ